MKKLFPIVLLMLASCTLTKQQKAEKLVKGYLDSVLNDPKSYEGKSFTKIEEEYLSYEVSDPEGKKLDSLAARYIDTSSKFKKAADDELSSGSINYKKYKSYNTLNFIYTKKSDSIESIIKVKGKGYKGPVDGYYIWHTYRAKNGFGALTLHTTKFEIDSAMIKVINADEAK